jgi:hypothetical protein
MSLCLEPYDSSSHPPCSALIIPILILSFHLFLGLTRDLLCFYLSMLNKEFGKWKVLQDCATEKAPLNRL